jgi:hypothetical protein
MRINQYISSFVFLNALATYAGEGTQADSASLTRDPTEKSFWVMRIKVPVGSDYFIKTSNNTQQIDDNIENPDDLTAFGYTAAVVPFDKKLDTNLDDDEKKVTTEYHVVAQMTWNATNATEIGGRGFWVGRGKDQKLLQDLEKVSVVSFERIALTPFQYIVKPRDWPMGDVTLWLGPDLSFVKTHNPCGSLNPEWLQCSGRGKGPEASNDWNGAYFREPKIAVHYPKGCAAKVAEDAEAAKATQL